MMLYYFDGAERLLTIAKAEDIREGDYTEQINAPSTLSVLTKIAPPETAYLALRDDKQPGRLRLYRVTKVTRADRFTRYEAIESAYDDLLADGYIQDKRPSGATVRAVSDIILEGSRWSTGNVASTKTITDNFYYTSRLEALHKVLGHGLEVRFTVSIANGRISSRVADWSDSFAVDRGRRYEHGDGLLETIAEEDHASIITAVVARGKGEQLESGAYGRAIDFSSVEWSKANGDPADKPLGSIMLELPERTAVYGYPDGRPRVGILELPDVDDPKELLAQAYRYLEVASRPRVTYRASVRDVGDTGLGDIVGIINDEIGVRYKTRIYKRRVNLLNDKDVTIELGDRVESYTSRRLKALGAKVETVGVTVLSQVQDMLDQMTMSYWGEDGYNYDLKAGNEHGLPAGMYSFDRPIDQDPTKFIYFGAGKLVISNSKNPDGSWHLSTLMDGDGLATGVVGAEQILAGAIKADHIDAHAITADKLAAGAITSDIITMVDGSNLETALSEIRQRRLFRSLPKPPYDVGDQWLQAPLVVGDLEALGWTIAEAEAWGIDVQDLMGGASYVCSRSRASGDFSRADWDLIATGDHAVDALAVKVSNYYSEQTAQGLRLTETVDLLTATGAKVDGVERYTNEISARQVLLDSTIKTLGESVDGVVGDIESVTSKQTDLSAGQVLLEERIADTEEGLKDANANITRIESGQALFVKGSDLSTAGGTQINGANIMTNTLTASQIQMVDASTVQQAIERALTGVDNVTKAQNTVYSDFPTPPYKANDVWLQPPLSIAQLQAKGWTIGQAQAMGLDAADLMGGNSYVCKTSRTSGNLVMADWVRVSMDDKETSDLYRLVTEYKASLDQQALRLEATSSLVTNQGTKIGTVENRLTNAEAGKITLSTTTSSVTGAWKVNSSATWTPNELVFSHSDGRETRIGASGLRSVLAGVSRPYHYRTHIQYITNANTDTQMVTLPADFKGKEFSVFFSIADSLHHTDTDVALDVRSAVHRIVLTLSPDVTNPIDSTNARVYYKAYKRSVNTETREIRTTPITGILIAIM